MTDAAPHDAPTCDAALTTAFAILGKRWNGMILGVLGSAPVSFSELRRALAGISDSVLSDRLSELTGAGLIDRTVDAGPPVGVRYSLTASGCALMPALDLVRGWAETNLLPGRTPA